MIDRAAHAPSAGNGAAGFSMDAKTFAKRACYELVEQHSADAVHIVWTVRTANSTTKTFYQQTGNYHAVRSMVNQASKNIEADFEPSRSE